jgi:hypothetical protein
MGKHGAGDRAPIAFSVPHLGYVNRIDSARSRSIMN